MRERFIRKLMDLLRGTSGALMLALIIDVAIQLLARNFIKVSVVWTEDVAKLLMIWMTFLGSPVVLYQGEHLVVDLIYAKVMPSKRKYIRLLSDLVITVFCVIVIRFGVVLCTNKVILGSVTAAAGIPRVCVYAALPVGMTAMALVSVNSLILDLLILTGRRDDDVHDNIVDESKTLDEIEGRLRE